MRFLARFYQANYITQTLSLQEGIWCLDTITYNRVTITFYRELRPDPISFTNGRYLGTTRYRLRLIAIKVDTSYLRAYRLTYGTSGVTRRSLLTSVQEYGHDVTLAGYYQLSARPSRKCVDWMWGG